LLSLAWLNGFTKAFDWSGGGIMKSGGSGGLLGGGLGNLKKKNVELGNYDNMQKQQLLLENIQLVVLIELLVLMNWVIIVVNVKNVVLVNLLLLIMLVVNVNVNVNNKLKLVVFKQNVLMKKNVGKKNLLVFIVNMN
jgi:hypothetical protein